MPGTTSAASRTVDSTAAPAHDKESLLNLLHVERGAEPAPEQSRPRRPWVLVAGLVAVLVVAGTAAAVYWRAQAVPVRVVQVQAVSASQSPARSAILDASGYIVPRRQATVSARIVGRVSHILIEEGQTVEAGQVIARLDDSTATAALAQANAQLAQARAGTRSAQTAFDVQAAIFNRQEKQFEAKLISAQDFDNSRAAYNTVVSQLDVAVEAVKVAQAQLHVSQQNLAETVIRAPFAGVVTVKAAQAGEIVSPSAVGGFTRTGIGTIVDMDSLELEVDISENFIHRVRSGQAAVVSLNAYPEWEIPATVIAVVPTADRAKATVKVRIGLQLKDPRIVPEMGAKVAFMGAAESGTGGVQRTAGALVIPNESVRASAQDAQLGHVFVVAGDRLQRRDVRLGAKTPNGQVVLSGLQPRETIVAALPPGLDEAGRVRVVQ